MTQAVRYLARLMELDGWDPQIESGSMLDACDSQLERMAALGLVWRAECAWSAATGERMPKAWGEDRWEFVDPWMIFPDQIGPTSMSIRPQVADCHLTRDFVVSYDDEDSVIVEVDGYAHHRKRRRADLARDAAASMPTIRYQEELEPPTEWPRRLLWHWDLSCTHCGVALGEHSCPPF